MSVLFITPPFTQLNTPYPATAYLKGYLNESGIESVQADLSLEVTLRVFSSEGLTELFGRITDTQGLSKNAARIWTLQDEYIRSVDSAIAFLQGKEQSLAYLISERDFLPEAGRFAQADDLDWAFGSMGTRDKARHLITLFLEDLTDFIRECVDAEFGMSRYAEHLGRMASSFDEIAVALSCPHSYIDTVLVDILHSYMERCRPEVVALSVPFPGNLYAALRCGEYIRSRYPDVKVVMGGGFPSTELRSLTDVRLFDYIDYLVLDDGEIPLLRLLQYIKGEKPDSALVRTFVKQNGQVVYKNDETATPADIALQASPDYSGLWLDRYLSVIEMVNPMHRLWSDGRWNKLTLAHGCYWGRCSFCDGSLDYIGRFSPASAVQIADRMERLIAETGERGFHFVDEAAPPALLKELALELLRRGLKTVWWTNIRFEKSYTSDLCRLLRLSGCIAVSGGLEVASDRLLKLINKGVTVEQVTRVADHFTQAGIMVHAYLMYGFPTQTDRETIDSLEIVRQLFMNGLVQSAFWHRFALTAHSPVGLNPEKFHIAVTEKPFGGFARNDLSFDDPSGGDHDKYGDGLSASLYNYMHGVGFDYPLQKWFEHKIPQTVIPPNYVERILDKDADKDDISRQVLWVGRLPLITLREKIKKGKRVQVSEWRFNRMSSAETFSLKPEWGEWWHRQVIRLQWPCDEKITMQMLADDFSACGLGDFALFLATPLWQSVRENELFLL